MASFGYYDCKKNFTWFGIVDIIHESDRRCFLNIVTKHTIPVLTDDDGEWGAISDNMTGDGILGTLVERRADIGISALYSWYKIDIYILP